MVQSVRRVSILNLTWIVLILHMVSGSRGVGAQDRMTVWDGVYTTAQAAQGRAHFEESCAGCHRSGSGGADAPGLDSDNFLEEWGEDNLISMFERIRNTMPARAPGSLSDRSYTEIVTYLLELNGFPSGTLELDVEAMASIRVEGPDGPGPVPDFALVEVRGCLSRDAQGGWIVSSATVPVRSRNPSGSSRDQLEARATETLGDETFELIYVFPEPDELEGHRIEAKGFLIRDPDPDQINVSSYTSIRATCP